MVTKPDHLEVASQQDPPPPMVSGISKQSKCKMDIKLIYLFSVSFVESVRCFSVGLYRLF